jgi:diadenosine tetraphosphate (Ap4A) HIT family hydrolase
MVANQHTRAAGYIVRMNHPLQPSACPLCQQMGGLIVKQAERWRVVRVDGPEGAAFPAFYRVIWQAHVAELSELEAGERAECLDVVVAIERVLRQHLAPTKINLASLGNVVPHLHWHVVARFDWDSHFPNPIWGAARRELTVPAESLLSLPLVELDQAVRSALR